MKKIWLTIYGFMIIGGLAMAGAEASTWTDQLWISTGGLFMFLLGVYFATALLRGDDV